MFRMRLSKIFSLFSYILPTWIWKGCQWLLNEGDSVLDLEEKKCSWTLLNLYPFSQEKSWDCLVILMASLMIWDIVCEAEASIAHLLLGPKRYETICILNRACPLKPKSLIPGQFMWDFWWKIWYWGRFCQSTLVSATNSQSIRCSISLTYHPGLVQWAIHSLSTKELSLASLTLPPAPKRKW
jgi:hypothetical protein